MSKGEWQDLVSQVDHSFWSMRVIGGQWLKSMHPSSLSNRKYRIPSSSE